MIRNKPTGSTKRPVHSFFPTVILQQLKIIIPILDRKKKPKFKLNKLIKETLKTKGKIYSKMNLKKQRWSGGVYG